ncbi:MAG: type II secretion system major pseudopilin GspG [Candidatus Aminicenantes bacterium]|nr:type II secretion system major pseudopilin GspG [Candidatus Aminicenantes bacterium]
MNRIKIRNNEKGFTLIEIIIVVIILSLIAALVGPRLFKKVEKSKQQITKTQIVMIENSVKMFKLDTGRYPTTEEGLKILMENTGGISNWDGPYLEKGIPKDPWGKDYVYTYPGKNYTFEIVSLGADGLPGGEGENKDINNWEIN